MYTDPFGLCKTETGEWRRCTVNWLPEASNRNITAEALAVAQDLADKADVDLYLSSGRRAAGDDCKKSLHNCGKAFDIAQIGSEDGVVDIGTGRRFNPGARQLVEHVQGVALSMSSVEEVLGPAGLFRSFNAGTLHWFSPEARSSLWNLHQNHIHIGIR